MSDDNKLLCAWCMQPVSDEGMYAYETSGGCDTCSYGQSTDIEVTCKNPECPKFNRVIYSKEISN